MELKFMMGGNRLYIQKTKGRIWNKMKKEYEIPKIEIVSLKNSDLITLSSTTKSTGIFKEINWSTTDF